MNKVELAILEHCPGVEIMIRCFLWKHAGIKEKML